MTTVQSNVVLSEIPASYKKKLAVKLNRQTQMHLGKA